MAAYPQIIAPLPDLSPSSHVQSLGLFLVGAQAPLHSSSGRVRPAIAVLLDRFDKPWGAGLRIPRQFTTGSLVGNPKLARDRGQPRIRRPQTDPPHESRREKVRVDPANAATLQPAPTDELHNLAMGHDWRLVHQGVVVEQGMAGALIPDEKLAKDEVVPAGLASRQKSLKFSGVRRAIGQEAVCATAVVPAKGNRPSPRAESAA